MIDLRSDTVTKPSKGMLDAMMSAQVGDDVFCEDPSVNKLQEMCAELTGKEAALFTPTGVLANQLAIKAHTQPGDEIITEQESHIYNYETAAPAVISNVQVYPVNGVNGILKASDVERAIKPHEYYFPVTRLITLENTHNRAGGVIQPLESIKEISTLAKKRGIKIHLDGARIFNACVETELHIIDYANHFDSIAFCFSKGLGTPAGSVVCGSKEFIAVCRKWRKILGGGMRQAGFLAAAAIYALQNNIERLKEDNDKAKAFASELSNIGGLQIEGTVQTNIVIFKYLNGSKDDFMNQMKAKGVLFSSGSYDFIRAVFHMDVSHDEVEKAIQILKKIS